MGFVELAAKRYSCKKYGEGQVDQEALDQILETGRLAPTARNSQEQRVYVLRSEEALAKIDELTRCRFGAPVVLMVAFDKGGAFTYPGQRYDSGVEDATIVATHLILAAADAGVDSCWVNLFDPDEAAKAFDLPDNEQVVALIDLGHAAEDAGPLPNHGKRKPLDETVTYL